MKYLTLNKSHITLFLLFFSFSILAEEETAEQASIYAATWWSVVPPLLAIAIALLFRQVIPALFTGLVVWGLAGTRHGHNGIVHRAIGDF